MDVLGQRSDLHLFRMGMVTGDFFHLVRTSHSLELLNCVFREFSPLCFQNVANGRIPQKAKPQKSSMCERQDRYCSTFLLTIGDRGLVHWVFPGLLISPAI